MRLAGFAGCRVVSGSLVVSGTLHEHPEHKTSNVKATMESSILRMVESNAGQETARSMSVC